jgi:hypothetical protein
VGVSIRDAVASLRSPAANEHKELSMTLSRPMQFGVLGVLALLMILTRGQHFASVDALPSASWAVFFLAGVFFRPPWAVGALIAIASAIDLAALESGKITQWCLSPAYWATMLAYLALWFSGRVYARLYHRDRIATLLPLGVALIATALLAYCISGGGFYFFSGRYPDSSLAGFGERLLHYYPPSLGNLALYVGAAAAVYAVARLIQRNGLQAQPAAR